MLTDSFKMFVTWASGLGDYQSLTKTQLANGYCDADERGDINKRDQYYAALILRYWYKIGEFAESSEFMRQPKEDFLSWVAESLDIGLKYRRWRDPSDKLYTDPNGPDKVFNRCFKSTRQRYFRYVNMDCRRASYLADSIDRQEDTFKDGADYIEDSEIIFNEVEEKQKTEEIRDIIQHFIDKGDLVDAVILDCIAFGDSTTRKKNSHTEFSQSKLTRILIRLNNNYTEDFIFNYDVDRDKIKEVVAKFVSSPKFQISRQIKKTIVKASRSTVVREALCY